MKPILSICIPTYNRIALLKKTLDSILKDSLFGSGKIEVVVSDNASTDGTKKVLQEEYIMKYKNLKYFCNIENLGAAENLYCCMERAEGRYLKLLNDTKPVKSDGLKELLIECETNDWPVIFTINDNKKPLRQAVNSIDNFLSIASYWVTWLPCICFRADLYKKINLDDVRRDPFSLLLQTDLMLRVLLIDCRALVIRIPFFSDLIPPQKGGYELFKVFPLLYFELLSVYLKTGYLKEETYQKNRMELLYKFIFPIIFQVYVLRSPLLAFEIKGGLKIVFHEYKKNIGLYLFPIWACFDILVKMIKKYLL